MKSAYLRLSTPKARAKAPVIRKCKACQAPFEKLRMGQKVCDWQCGLVLAAREREKAEAKQDRVKREGQKRQPELVEEAQKAFNAYIRLRDAGLPCICCGKQSAEDTLTGGDWDAGHYRSRGAAPELKFDERNCHKQLKRCNRRAWDVASYRANLIQRIGLAEVEALEGPHPPKKYSRDELRTIRDTYRAKVRALKM